MFSVLSIVLTIATLAFIAYPLFWGRGINEYSGTKPQIHNIKGHKETIMATLGEIEFDFQMRKLSEEDYLNLKGKYLGAAVEILKSEQENELRTKKIPTKSRLALDLEREIEEELLALEKKK